MADTVIAGALLMQPKNSATSVAIAQLRLERHNGRWTVTHKRSWIIQAKHHREDSQILAVAAEGHRLAVRYAATQIGTTPVAWRGDSGRVVATPLTNFVLDVERRASGAQLASAAVFSLDSLASGPITIAGMTALYPYDNTLRAVRVSGEQLREYLEHSARYFLADAYGVQPDPTIPGYNYDVVAGVDYEIDVSKPIGSRITRLEFQGRPVAATDTFTMAVSNFRQAGGGGFSMLHGAPVVYDQQQDIRELLIDEVRKRGTLKPTDFAETNWKVVNGEK
jgi:2',3'-cyclic-nucleotide 2'-phosphodiesterase/3'-nucleotidase